MLLSYEMFTQKMHEIQAEFQGFEHFNDVDISLCFSNAVISVREKINYQGAYHVREDGYCRGNAGNDDIVLDAKMLGIETGNRDIDDIRHDLFSALNDKLLVEFRTWLEETFVGTLVDVLKIRNNAVRKFDTYAYGVTDNQDDTYNWYSQEQSLPPFEGEDGVSWDEIPEDFREWVDWEIDVQE